MPFRDYVGGGPPLMPCRIRSGQNLGRSVNVELRRVEPTQETTRVAVEATREPDAQRWGVSEDHEQPPSIRCMRAAPPADARAVSTVERGWVGSGTPMA
jgi:hypothetical protein